jgi:hypothetical protein
VIELLDEIFEVDATDGVGESGEVCASGQIHAAGRGEIAFFEVEEGDGGLDESWKNGFSGQVSSLQKSSSTSWHSK